MIQLRMYHVSHARCACTQLLVNFIVAVVVKNSCRGLEKNLLLKSEGKTSAYPTSLKGLSTIQKHQNWYQFPIDFIEFVSAKNQVMCSFF